MALNTWTQHLRRLFEKAVTLYGDGQRGAETYFDENETAFLASIGLRPIHVYDCAEDFVGSGEPDWETTLLMAAARRDFFLHEQNGEFSKNVIAETTLPLRKDDLDGIPWLPRILTKARAYLRGELASDVMYCCGGDRRFLEAHNVHPADFLRVVWSARDDDSKVLAYVRASAVD